MAIDIFSIVIAIAICHVPLVVRVASVEVRATPGFCSAIIDVAVAAPQPGAVVSRVAAPNSGSATAFKAAGRTIAAPQTWAATVATASQRGSAAATVTATTAAAAQRASAAAAVTAATTATGAGAPTTAAPTSASSTAFAGKIDKVGAGVG
jgi:chemotaxis protein MotB